NSNTAVTSEATLASADASTFTLNWTTNDANPWAMHFIAIGGAGVQARAISFGGPASVGLQQYNSIGFLPEVVVFDEGGVVLGPPLPSQHPWSGFRMGAATSSGRQWSVCAMDNWG